MPVYINTEFGRALVGVKVHPGPYRLLLLPWVASLELEDGYKLFNVLISGILGLLSLKKRHHWQPSAATLLAPSTVRICNVTIGIIWSYFMIRL